MNLMKFFILLLVSVFAAVASSSEIAITMDNPNTYSWPLLTAENRDAQIRSTLANEKLQIMLFVAGNEVDSPEGKELLKKWDDENHIIANHTYSHKNYNSASMSFEWYSADILRNEPLITPLKNFRKYFRFVMLKEGNTLDKRDMLRAFFKQQGYLNIPVTVDASDWYIDARMRTKLSKNPKADLKPYRDYYLAHIWDRTQYYDKLATELTGRKIKHTLLIHHNLLNALFLKDLIAMYRSKGWKVVAPAVVMSEPVLHQQPNVVPAGESVVWSMAKDSGKFDSFLRYPAEDGVYEEPSMDKLGL